MAFPGSRLLHSFSRASVLALGLAAPAAVAVMAAVGLFTPASCVDGTTPNCADAACNIAYDAGPDASDAQTDGASDGTTSSDAGVDSGVPPVDASPDAGQASDASDAALG